MTSSKEREAPSMPEGKDSVVAHPIFAFLDGSAPFEGVWFGERHPAHTGAFWWRSVLRDALAAAGAKPETQEPLRPNLGDKYEPTMNIYAQPGTVVRFRAGGGYDWEKQSAEKAGFVRNALYTVKRCDIGHSKTEVLFDEIPGRWNSCLFADVAAFPSPAYGSAEGATVAWLHEDDDRSITAQQKAQAINDGGASASSVAPYSIALVRAAEGAKPAVPDEVMQALEQALEFAADHEDIRDGADGPLPNRAMNLAAELRAVISKIQGGSHV